LAKDGQTSAVGIPLEMAAVVAAAVVVVAAVAAAEGIP
jgi:hypothetical protein